MSKYVAKKPDNNGYIHFTPEENETWQILITRQMETIKDRACPEFLTGLKALAMPIDHIPQCSEISAALTAASGWSVTPVDAIIPLEKFFSLLAARQFPAATFIRTRADLDYLQEPDIFHEYFGHCPLLTHPAYADFVQWYGEHALGKNKKTQSLLGRLFWFTVEFGLVHTAAGLRIYGGGILSSHAEAQYALESTVPERLPFDLIKILMTEYHYDQIQKVYFCLSDMKELFELKSDKVIQLVEQMVVKGQDDNFVIC
jgi:phenylalanine-4-hydroxylase